MASIQIKKGKRATSYRVEFMRDGNRASRTFKTPKEAEQFLALVLLDHSIATSLTNRSLQNLKLADAIDEFLKQYQGKDHRIQQRLSWWRDKLGQFTVTSITKHQIRQSLKALINSGLSGSTSNRYKAAISRVFRYMQDEYDLTRNPAREIRQQPEPQLKERFLSEEELQRLFKAAKLSTWSKLYLLILLAVSTGARRSELLNLKWDDINFQAKTAFVEHSKNGASRFLPLTQDAIKELKKHRYNNSFIFTKEDSSQPLFNFDYYWKHSKKMAGVSNLRFHDLRHTTGSWLAMNNVSLKAIQEILGHRTIITTQRYVHHNVKYKAEAVEMVFGQL